MNNKYDIVIVGAGLGGLLTGNILSREGFHVCIIEKNNKIGGSIQSFVKNKTIFNTGLNYTESLGDGQILNRYFKYFKIFDKLNFKQLDINHFNKISFSNDEIEYPFAQGHENFIEILSSYFPNSKNNLKKYIDTLGNICKSFPLYTLDPSINYNINNKLLQANTYDFLKTVHSNHKLQQILGGMNPLYGAVTSKTPLYVHALINYSFINSAWRLVDGSSQLINELAKIIKQNGGTILTSSKVESIEIQKGEVTNVKLENGEKIFAKRIISNLHPSATLKMLPEIFKKKTYVKRINSLENSIGMFTIYMVMHDESFPYLNFNHHHYLNENTWTAEYKKESWPEHYFLYTPATSKSDKWANGVIAMTYMRYEEVKQWENTFIEKRGKDYLNFKRQKAEKLIDFIEQKFPNIRKSIKCYYTSTPLSYRDYTGTPNGSSYGIIKNYNNLLETIIRPKSRIPNLYFTGQNLNLHGILGVTISSVLTSSEFLGYEYLIKKIRNE